MRRSVILGKGMLLPQWCRHNCTWPTVGGVRARGVRSGAVVRLLQGPFAHGSTWGGEGGKTSSPLGDRSGVFHAWYWTEDLVRSVMCCYQGGQLLDATSGAMDGRGTCYLYGLCTAGE